MKKANLLPLVILAQAFLFYAMHTFGIISIGTLGIRGFATIAIWFLVYGICSYCITENNTKAIKIGVIATVTMFVIESISEMFLVRILYDVSQPACYVMYAVESVLGLVIVLVLSYRIAGEKTTYFIFRVIAMIVVFAVYIATAIYVVNTLPEFTTSNNLFDVFTSTSVMPRYDAMVKVHALYYALEGACLTLFCMKTVE